MLENLPNAQLLDNAVINAKAKEQIENNYHKYVEGNQEYFQDMGLVDKVEEPKTSPIVEEETVEEVEEDLNKSNNPGWWDKLTGGDEVVKGAVIVLGAGIGAMVLWKVFK